MFGDDQYCSIHSKCWWMSRERLIVDDADAEELVLGSISIPADIYSIALTISQVDLASFRCLPDSNYCDHNSCGHLDGPSPICAISTDLWWYCKRLQQTNSQTLLFQRTFHPMCRRCYEAVCMMIRARGQPLDHYKFMVLSKSGGWGWGVTSRFYQSSWPVLTSERLYCSS